ncbi:AAA family ATPase [Candidatus Formimonas warabiya]|nr:AAA family ATPase [Candidatus Formimonas warabiya]
MIKLADYIISEKIHENNRISVYRGQTVPDRKPVVIKALKAEAANPAAVSRLMYEYEIARDLDIPGIVRPVRLERAGASLALIMEDTGAGSLRAYLSGHRPDLAAFLSLARQLTHTLGELHAKGVIHRDLKPDNILIQADTGEVKIIDFSTAAFFAGENENTPYSGTPVGTPEYMSPEQTGRMNRAVDYRSDFYALGVVFYEILTGRLPFQAGDPVQWAYVHMTQKPVPPEEINPGIPFALSRIMLKLLAKTPEERYQSTAGLLWDLTAWNQPSFLPGGRDFSPHFHLPRKLYGREKEAETLAWFFTRVCGGQAGTVMVHGYGGTGKTMLVGETMKSLVRENGYFISGKFDQLRQKVPYAPFVQALQDFIRQLMTESGEDLAAWRKRFFRALGRNGGVITQVIPEVALLLGKQVPAEPLHPAEAQNRFRMVFQKFFRVCARKEHPLILFLDDLHWADPESLQLIRHLAEDPGNRYLLLMGAYRDNEVPESHPLARTLKEMEEGGIPVQYLQLHPLSRSQAGQYIADTLQSAGEKAFSLAEVLHRKSGGNPFFLGQLLKSLYDEKGLRFNLQEGCWEWEAASLEEMDIPQDVVDFMLAKLRKLPGESRAILKAAACLGHAFDLQTLSLACEQSAWETVTCLRPAIQAGLVRPVIPAFEFFHDRIHEAAYALIPEEEKKQLHIKAGRLLLKHTGPDQLEEKIFAIMDQVNHGLDLIDDPRERLELARYNLKAGQKAKASAAYAAALSYFQAGLDLLPDRAWQEHYRLAYHLHLECAQCAYLCAYGEEAEKMFDLILDRAESRLDRADVYGLKMVLYAGVGKVTEAVQLGVSTLESFGVKLPLAPGKLDYLKEVLRYKWLMRRKSIEKLARLPEMKDPVQRKVAELIILLACVAYTSNPDLHGLVIIKSGNHSVTYGNTVGSAIGYLGYGITAGCVLGDYQAGHEFMQVSLRLAEKDGQSFTKCLVYFVVGGLISHWTQHAKRGIEYLSQSLRYSREAGEVLIMGYARSVILEIKYLIGMPLPEIEEEAAKCHRFARQMKQEALMNNVLIYQWMLSLLQGRQETSPPIPVEDFQKEPTLLATYDVAQMQMCYHFGNFAQGLVWAEEAGKRINSLMGFLLSAEYNFYYSLILAQLYPGAAPEKRRRYRKMIQKNQKQMKKWADSCPENFRHKYLLVAAEMARLTGQGQEAMDLYDQAAQSAQENGYIQNEALANELAARFYLGAGRNKVARTYLKDACRGYYRWGAGAKGRALREQYPHLLDNPPRGEQNLVIPSSSVSDSDSFGGWDLLTVRKALQNFSEERDPDKLLKNFLAIALESTGAAQGHLILEKEGELFVEGPEPVPLEKCSHLPRAVVRYVARTLETVVVNGGEPADIFARDPYLIKVHPKSLACFPMLFRGIPAGVLYLENSLMTGVFTPDRLETVKYLSTQMACLQAVEMIFTGDHTGIQSTGQPPLVEFLTDREGEVADLIAAGLSNKEISERLHLTVNTVKTHVKNIYGKLAVTNRVQVAARVKELKGNREGEAFPACAGEETGNYR